MKVVEVADHRAVWFRVCDTCGVNVNEHGLPLHMSEPRRADFCSWACLRSRKREEG